MQKPSLWLRTAGFLLAGGGREGGNGGEVAEMPVIVASPVIEAHSPNSGAAGGVAIPPEVLIGLHHRGAGHAEALDVERRIAADPYRGAEVQQVAAGLGVRNADSPRWLGHEVGERGTWRVHHVRDLER